MKRAGRLLLPLVTALVLLAVWQIGMITEVLNPALLPPPMQILGKITELTLDGTFLRHGSATVWLALSGLSVGVVGGLPLGAWMGMSRRADRALSVYVEFLRALPAAALIPMFMVLMPRDAARTAVVAVPVGLVMAVSCRVGILGNEQVRWDLGRLYGVSGMALFRKVLVWGALPSILSGLRISISLALVLATVVEMLVGARFGLGDLILNAQALQKPTMYAAIFALGVVGYTLNAVVLTAESAVLGRMLGRRMDRGR